jgi:hypothetical protein
MTWIVVPRDCAGRCSWSGSPTLEVLQAAVPTRPDGTTNVQVTRGSRDFELAVLQNRVNGTKNRAQNLSE